MELYFQTQNLSIPISNENEITTFEEDEKGIYSAKSLKFAGIIFYLKNSFSKNIFKYNYNDTASKCRRSLVSALLWDRKKSSQPASKDYLGSSTLTFSDSIPAGETFFSFVIIYVRIDIL